MKEREESLDGEEVEVVPQDPRQARDEDGD